MVDILFRPQCVIVYIKVGGIQGLMDSESVETWRMGTKTVDCLVSTFLIVVFLNKLINKFNCVIGLTREAARDF